jgi:hypothetical protein
MPLFGQLCSTLVQGLLDMFQLDLQSRLLLLFELKLQLQDLLLPSQVVDNLVKLIARRLVRLRDGIRLSMNLGCLGGHAIEVLMEEHVLLARLVEAAPI